jgi:hypothetical protein
MICKYCGKEYRDSRAYPKPYCGTCKEKKKLLPRFVEARDNLREQLGLERMWSCDGV